MLLAVRAFEVGQYRSLRAIRWPLGSLDVLVGANGAGKTNLYRALQLLQAAANNTLALELAREGGLNAAMWAGTRRKNEPARIRLAVELGEDVAPASGGSLRYETEVGHPVYEVQLGRVTPTGAAFPGEPLVKKESLAVRARGRWVRLMDRNGPSVMVRDESGRPAEVDLDLLDSETVLGRLEDPGRHAELDAVRRALLQWRFYHHLRTDADSPLRRPCPAVAAPTLASDGANLAAVFATLVHIRQDTRDLADAIADAFPGAELQIPMPEGQASFGLILPEFPRRVFEASELSDGTLRFLALAGALMAYRLPPLVVLNEPETSLHPDLIDPLARMIRAAGARAQVLVVTHSDRLAHAIGEGGGKARTVLKTDGETRIEGLRAWGAFADEDED